MKKYIELITYLILVFFGLIGMATSAFALHEYSHFKDLRNYTEKGDLCLLNIPVNQGVLDGKGGVYFFTYNKSQELEVNNILKTTEIKAYTIFALVGIVFAIVVIVNIHWRFKNEKEKYSVIEHSN